MTLPIRYTNAARRDLEGIFLYSKQNWGLAQARVYSRKLRDHVRGLARNSTFSRPVADAPEALRQTRCEKHIVVFEIQPQQILIVRVLHEAMDIPRHVTLSD